MSARRKPWRAKCPTWLNTTSSPNCARWDILRARACKMSHLAQHDFLTELPNRILLNDRLTQAIAMAERHHKKLAVLFVDVDLFKTINDSLGHAIGDAVLQSIAKRLRENLRNTDTVSR